MDQRNIELGEVHPGDRAWTRGNGDIRQARSDYNLGRTFQTGQISLNNPNLHRSGNYAFTESGLRPRQNHPLAFFHCREAIKHPETTRQLTKTRALCNILLISIPANLLVHAELPVLEGRGILPEESRAVAAIVLSATRMLCRACESQ
jgi:hypothetical protein